MLKQHVDVIEAFIISHNDSDHDFNTSSILAAYPNAINKIFFLQDRSPKNIRVFAVLKNSKEDLYPTPVRLEANGGAPRILFSDSNIELSVIFPDIMHNLDAQTSKVSAGNKTSAVLKLSCGCKRIIYSSDATFEAWQFIASQIPNSKPLSCDVISVSHHGGAISQSDSKETQHQHQLYHEIINPHYAVVSVGTHNQYGHPSKACLCALRTAGVKVLCTQMTECCSPGLESIRALRRFRSNPSRSTLRQNLTQSGKSKHVACYGSVVVEVGSKQINVKNIEYFMSDFKAFSSESNFTPMCIEES